MLLPVTMIVAAATAASSAAPTVPAVTAALPSSPAAAPAGGAAPPSATAAPVDPARLAAARNLIELIMPAANRKAMLGTLMAAFSGQVRRGFESTPEFKAQVAADPRVRPILDRFLARTEARSAALLDANLPALFDAMGRAYARRFTVAQLADLNAFFASPTGRYYAATAPTVLADPDIAVANQALMKDAVARSHDDIAAMAAEIKALPPLPAPAKPGT